MLFPSFSKTLICAVTKMRNAVTSQSIKSLPKFIRMKIPLIFPILRCYYVTLPTYSYEEQVMRYLLSQHEKTFPLLYSGRDPLITSSGPANHLITLSVPAGLKLAAKTNTELDCFKLTRSDNHLTEKFRDPKCNIL